ncbi:hypothetical protein CONLIGDRAFT_677987 [Coniochaeta ligniaria NRRL 30616]|uniref:Uncharacterized protein n=1 Tax=Coniochaeta ligniaria NRRL 30616 TaxID=1408157 RepID=A0A1J7IWG9_9PEZI|nr:hypothetical protein CONLIGDRAFT_677987 [Coniochaeta ligniaria NRRL 30616]
MLQGPADPDGVLPEDVNQHFESLQMGLKSLTTRLRPPSSLPSLTPYNHFLLPAEPNQVWEAFKAVRATRAEGLEHVAAELGYG